MFSPPCYRRRGCSCYLMYSWRTFCYRTALADPGGRPPPLILEQTEVQTAEKIFCEDRLPPPPQGLGPALNSDFLEPILEQFLP